LRRLRERISKEKGKFMSWCYIPSCEISSRKKGLSFFIALNRVQNFPSEKTKKMSNKRQAESFLTFKTKLTFKGCLKGFLKRLESWLFPALLPSISTGFRHGERLEGGSPQVQALFHHLCLKWRKPLGVGPLAPGPPPAPLQAP